MHFALPPRKTSHPPPYARASRTPPRYGKQELKLLGYSLCCILVIYLFVHFAPLARAPVQSVPSGTPTVVIVTVFDERHFSDQYIQKIKSNREDYAGRHGYQNFFASSSNYTSYTHPAPVSWTLVPAIRHALTKFPHTTHFFSLSQHALIMSPSLSLEEHILAPARLQSLMQKDIPIIPPDSVIRTFSHLEDDQVNLIMTQDGESLSHGSFLLRQGEWARFFLDAWFSPLYRSYNFKKAEAHALEHMVQWHPTVLAKLAVVPQRVMNSLSINITLDDGKGNLTPLNGTYEPGDFLVRFHGCSTVPDRDCEKEILRYERSWKSEVARLNTNQS